MLSPEELSTQISMTKAFIDADPVDIMVFNPGGRIPDGEGGWVEIGTDPFPVHGRLIPQNDKTPVNVSGEGFRPAPEFILLTLPGSAMIRGSIFEYAGATWKVDQMHPAPEYEKKGDVYLYERDQTNL